MTSPTDLAWAFARPNTRSVGRPATTSRKWCDSRASSRHRRRVRSAVVAPTRAMNTGISGSVTMMMAAESGSATSKRTTTASGMTTASTTCGRYLAK